MTVVVAGAGPVGLAMALTLADSGVPVRLIEKRAAPNAASLASTFLPPTLELLEALRVFRSALDKGLVVTEVAFEDLDRGDRRALDTRRLADECTFPFRLHLGQRVVCQMLRQELVSRHGIECEFGAELVDAVAHDSTARVRVVRDGDAETISCAWLVACDGASSTVRRLLGLGFPGKDYPDPIIRLHCRQLPRALQDRCSGVTYLRRAARTLSVLKMRESWRVIVRPPRGLDLQTALDPEWHHAYLSDFVGPDWEPVVAEVDYYYASQRLIERNVEGRVVLIGDAAHVTNTRGGMNMNCGLLEAVQIGGAIASWWHTGRHDRIVRDAARRRYALARAKLLPRTDRLVSTTATFELARALFDGDEGLRYLRDAMVLDLV